MTLNKETWCEAIAQYRKWNEDVLASQVLARSEMDPEKKWRAYLDLCAFARRIKPDQSEWVQEQHARDWEAYHARILEFERRRRLRGSGTCALTETFARKRPG